MNLNNSSSILKRAKHVENVTVYYTMILYKLHNMLTINLI